MQIDDREVLRIFKVDNYDDYDYKITLFAFFNDNQLIKSVFQAEPGSHIIFSEDSDEIAVISRERKLMILKINEKHEFYVSGEGQVKKV